MLFCFFTISALNKCFIDVVVVVVVVVIIIIIIQSSQNNNEAVNIKSINNKAKF